MKSYTYYISAVFDDGTSSEDRTATSKKEALKKLAIIRKHSLQHLKNYDSVELYIDRSNDSILDNKSYENIYFRKIK